MTWSQNQIYIGSDKFCFVNIDEFTFRRLLEFFTRIFNDSSTPQQRHCGIHREDVKILAKNSNNLLKVNSSIYFWLVGKFALFRGKHKGHV